MSTNVGLPIVKGNDNDYCEALLRIADTEPAKALGLGQLSFTPIVGPAIGPLSTEDVRDHEVLQRFLKANGRAIKTFTLSSSGRAQVSFTRNDNFQQGTSTPDDKLSFFLGDKATEDQLTHLATLVAEAQKVVKSFSIDNLGPWLGDAAQKHLSAREEALTRLETLHSTLLHDFERQRALLRRELVERETTLAEAFAKKTEELEEEYRNRTEQLNEREAHLESRRKELDDRSSTHVRRELREKLKEILTERQKSFALSKDTQLRRRHVFWTYVVLLVLFGVPAGIFLWQELAADAWNPWTFGRQVSFSLAFVVTAGFFLAWLNRWAQQHADEEFKLKELEVDIDRASWVVEMALEWRAEKGEDIPAHLVDRLSANLFGSSDGRLTKDFPMTGADAVARILVDTAARAKLTFPGGEMELDKRSLRKLARSNENG